MKPILVLLIVFVVSLVVIKLISGHFDYFPAGRIAMSVMLLFTAIGHFKFTKGMTMMMPDFVPFKKQLVYFTGLLEIAAAVGLQWPLVQKMTGLLLIVFFILILPANIRAAVKHIDYERGTYEGAGTSYLWKRIPIQIIFIVWVYWFSLYKY